MSQTNALPAPPVSPETADQAARLIAGLDASSLTWLSGYMAGAAASTAGAPVQAVATPATDQPRLTVLYGSQTGNAKRVADDLAQRASQAGLDVRLERADSYPLRDLAKERLLYVVISTHSAGDEIKAPDDSVAFIEHLQGRRAPKLPDLHYAVLALGDTSYPNFCGIGRYIDERFEELGANRLLDRGDADVDIETVAEPWSEHALDQARERMEQDSPSAAQSAPTTVVTPLHAPSSNWSRNQPFEAEVLLNQRIVAHDSSKDVRHIELLLEGSGLRYQPGDALGVWATQDPALVEAVLQQTGLDGDTEVTCKDETLPLSRWLGERRELTSLTRPFLVAHAQRGKHAQLERILQPGEQTSLAAVLDNTQLLDLLQRFPTRWDAEGLVANLRPLAPRMYSIASSQAAVGDEVHLTVNRLHYTRDGEERWGVASRMLCDAREGQRVRVFIDANDRFRLPRDPDTDIIMIGPGTGVAPFRGFLQQRADEGGSGRNWLLFGNPHRRTDFLYQLEWLQARKRGLLTRLDVAFSRDQEHKIYVQDRIRENGAELWRWLDGGAHLYLCGDAKHMAPDVEDALREVIAEHGGKDAEQARDWLTRLTTEGRFARDVY